VRPVGAPRKPHGRPDGLILVPKMRRRLAFIGLVLVVLAGGLVWRLADLQVRNPERYVAWGQSQRLEVVPLPGPRGEILDRNGERLAISIPQRTIWADPSAVTDPIGEAAILAPIIGVSEAELRPKLSGSGQFAYLLRLAPDEVADEVMALGLDGVSTLEEPKRFNPSGEELAGNLIGQVGIDNIGLSGVELLYDEVLTGTPGQLTFERDPSGSTIPVGDSSMNPAHAGSDVRLTLDSSLQFEVERILANQVTEMGAKGAVAVVSNPKTGEVLSMTSVDRNDDGTVTPSTENRAVTWAFEPGSVMKALTFSGVLEDGVGTPESYRDVPHWFNLYDAEFTDSHEHATAWWTITDVVTQSSNVGTIMWAIELGRARLDHYLRAFGFGSDTGLGLSGETPGLVLDLDSWSGTSIGSIPIGQGISVTPLQMAVAYGAIANGGERIAPTVVADITEPDGDIWVPEGASTERIISELSAQQMTDMLENVVAVGTGTAAAVPGYSVAGKTGTAQKPQPTGGYIDAAGNFQYIASFIGFLPAEDPELVIVVSIDEPSASIFGGVAAAPAFAEIAQYALRRFKIPPSSEVATGPDPTTLAAGDESAVQAPVAGQEVADGESE
jgi:cell division protein FtsI (penicillin-binding protein 3)